MSRRTGTTAQTAAWTGEFGRAYTDRNTLSPRELDALYTTNFGVTRRALNESFLAGVPRDARILEVGCNCGNQLLLLQEMDFSNLSGAEVQSYALESGRSRVHGVDLVQASALRLPFEDESFDRVFTSGVLIHISPDDLPAVLDEIHRCAKTWIWGMEYYAPEVMPVHY